MRKQIFNSALWMTMLVMAAALSAQTPAKPATPANQPPAKPGAATPAANAQAPAGKNAAPAANAAKPAEPQKSGIRTRLEEEKAKVEAALAAKKKAEPAKSVATKDVVDISKAMASANKRRDPFVNPIQAPPQKGGAAPVCTGTGPKCMSTDQIILVGVVKTPGGMIAMVQNAARKEYNMHEKDPILNGYVFKITGDSVIFRINTTNLMGVPTTQDVVKKVTVPAI